MIGFDCRILIPSPSQRGGGGFLESVISTYRIVCSLAPKAHSLLDLETLCYHISNMISTLKPHPAIAPGRSTAQRSRAGFSFAKWTALTVLCAFLGLGAAGFARAEAPKIVASIKPVHSLVAGVTEGVTGGLGAPYLLVRGYASPHAFALRPSDASALASAKIVFWIGPGMERFLERPLAALATRARIVALSEAPRVRRLRLRGADAFDPHIWLDPGNAKAMVWAIAAGLSAADPGNAVHYRANAERLQVRLDRLDAEITRALEPVRSAPYLVLHDAYRYFERRYRLNQVAAATLGAQSRPGARQMILVRKRLRETGARCLFREPGAAPGLAATLVQGTGARIAVLDPIGAHVKPGRDAYFTIMRRMARDFRRCLARPKARP